MKLFSCLFVIIEKGKGLRMKKIAIFLIFGLLFAGGFAFAASCNCANDKEVRETIVSTYKTSRGTRYNTKTVNGRVRTYYVPNNSLRYGNRNYHHRSSVVNVAPPFPPPAPRLHSINTGVNALPYVPASYVYTGRRY